ncbi:Gfo/Idh/MocA family oxidoreductase [Vannielia litorea]|nr:Gfo/Idh/MocA family oxidoreductase [Vannielia litorea]
MNLASMLAARNATGRPVRVGLIGAGKFGSMILAQARHIEGLHVVGVADLDVKKARESFARVHWPREQYAASSVQDALSSGQTWITEDAGALMACEEIECIIEATGHPLAGTRHALAAIGAGKHVVMVNVEADVMVGALLAEKARQAGVVYSMAYGDQPAAMCELVDWVKSCGFELVAAGKGMNFCPSYRYSTPDTVWDYFDFTPEQVKSGDFNPKMYNSFTDGTKAAIEMAAVANATGMDCPKDGLAFPPAGLQDLAEVFKPVSEGGQLEKTGIVDIAASREPDGRTVLNNIQYGMFVTFKAPNEYTRQCFNQYGLMTDKSGWYGSMWRPFHLIGLETAMSVLSACLRQEPTGSSRLFRADAVAAAKGSFDSGEYLDGEGGFKVWAKAIPATESVALNALPIGLAHHVRLKRSVSQDQVVSLDDVDIVDDLDIHALRREQRRLLSPGAEAAQPAPAMAEA